VISVDNEYRYSLLCTLEFRPCVSEVKGVNVPLTAELEQLVNEKVASGMYSSASEVIREGLRLLKERDELRRIQREELRRDILMGAEQIRQGKGKKYAGGAELADGVKRRGRGRLEAGRKGGK
jgi:antitoxin ParD1/3/4